MVEHGQTLEYDPRVKPGQARVDQMEFPGLGTFPRHKWWRFRVQRARPRQSLIPGFEPGSFINGLPGYIDVVNRGHRFVQFIIPIDRDHLYNMMVVTIPDRLRELSEVPPQHGVFHRPGSPNRSVPQAGFRAPVAMGRRRGALAHVCRAKCPWLDG
jgi:hypothetical protein